MYRISTVVYFGLLSLFLGFALACYPHMHTQIHTHAGCVRVCVCLGWGGDGWGGGVRRRCVSKKMFW